MKSLHQVLVLFLLTIVSTNTFAGLISLNNHSEIEGSSTPSFFNDDFSSLVHAQNTYTTDLLDITTPLDLDGDMTLFGCSLDGSDGKLGCEGGIYGDGSNGNEWLRVLGNEATITTSSTVSAFGFNFASMFSNINILSLTIKALDINQSITILDINSGFFGIGSDDASSLGSSFALEWEVAPFGSPLFPSSINTQGVDIDNLAFTVSAEEVPEPTTVLLFGLALAAIATRRAKRI